MKIGYFFETFPWYPLTFVFSEIRCLIDNGYSVTIFTFRKGDRKELHEEFQDLWDQIDVVPVGGRWRQIFLYIFFRILYPSRVLSLERKFRIHTQQRIRMRTDRFLLPAFGLAYHLKKRNDIDFLHTHFTGRASTLTYVASQLLSIPRGFTTHADSFVAGKYKLLADQIRDSAVVFSETRQAVKNIHQLYSDTEGFDGTKIIYKPTGVSLERFSFSRNLTNGYKLISVSRFDPKKGLIDLVKACGILHRNGKPVHCKIIGDASNKKEEQVYREIVDYITREKLGHIVELTGFLPRQEHIRYLQQSSIFIAPSIVTPDGSRDGVPTALIEAMALGLVPVTTSAGAITELVRDGMNGIVVPEKDPEAIAEAIERIAGDDALFENLRHNARKTVERERDENQNELIFVDYLKAQFDPSAKSKCREARH